MDYTNLSDDELAFQLQANLEKASTATGVLTIRDPFKICAAVREIRARTEIGNTFPAFTKVAELTTNIETQDIWRGDYEILKAALLSWKP